MDQQERKERTLAQIKLQQNLKNAGETLKRYGLKAHTRDKHALVKHRRSGRPNAEFFEERGAAASNRAVLLSSPARPIRTAKAPRRPVVIEKNEFIEMMPNTSNQINKAKKTYKKRVQNYTALRKDAEDLQRKAGKIEEECAQKIIKMRALAKERLERAKEEEKALTSFIKTHGFSSKNIKVKRPMTTMKKSSQMTALTQLETPKSIEKKNNIFVKSGKKGLTSEKGRAWHANIAKARQDIQSYLQSQGITQKPTGTVAIQYASLLRKDPSAAATFRSKILQDIKAKTQKNISTSTSTPTSSTEVAVEYSTNNQYE
jgi:hypothetical protein